MKIPYTHLPPSQDLLGHNACGSGPIGLEQRIDTRWDPFSSQALPVLIIPMYNPLEGRKEGRAGTLKFVCVKQTAGWQRENQRYAFCEAKYWALLFMFWVA